MNAIKTTSIRNHKERASIFDIEMSATASLSDTTDRTCSRSGFACPVTGSDLDGAVLPLRVARCTRWGDEHVDVVVAFRCAALVAPSRASTMVNLKAAMITGHAGPTQLRWREQLGDPLEVQLHIDRIAHGLQQGGPIDSYEACQFTLRQLLGDEHRPAVTPRLLANSTKSIAGSLNVQPSSSSCS